MRTTLRTLFKPFRYAKYVVLSTIVNRFIFYVQRVRCTRFPRTSGWIVVENQGQITLGSGVVLNSASIYNPVGAFARCQLIAKPNADIVIEDHVGISSTTIVAFTHIHIGSHVTIGGDCKIYDSDFHSLVLAERTGRSTPDNVKSRPIHIRDGAFIGAHSIILKGVTIGENAIIGAGSVVTKDIPANEIWAGNPARCVGKVPSLPVHA